MDNEVKQCRECKHFIVKEHEGMTQTFRFPACRHRAAMVPHNEAYLSTEFMRSVDGFKGPCGAEGVLWEPRPITWIEPVKEVADLPAAKPEKPKWWRVFR